MHAMTMHAMATAWCCGSWSDLCPGNIVPGRQAVPHSGACATSMPQHKASPPPMRGRRAHEHMYVHACTAAVSWNHRIDVLPAKISENTLPDTHTHGTAAHAPAHGARILDHMVAVSDAWVNCEVNCEVNFEVNCQLSEMHPSWSQEQSPQAHSPEVSGFWGCLLAAEEASVSQSLGEVRLSCMGFKSAEVASSSYIIFYNLP